MTHQHHFHLQQDLALTLPDFDGWHDRVMTWSCDCGKFMTITGSFNIKGGPVTLPDLVAVHAQEQREGTGMARIAQREDALRRRQRAWERQMEQAS
jgi:hypothetical protein